MKTLLTLIFSCIAFMAISQDTTYTLKQIDYTYAGTDNSKAWLINFMPDTIEAASNDDTLVINLSHNFGSFYTALLEITMDTTALTADLEGTYEIRTAQCLTCPYTTIETVTIPNVDVYTRDTFYVDNIKMQIRIIGTSGVGILESWLTLKPVSGSW